MAEGHETTRQRTGWARATKVSLITPLPYGISRLTPEWMTRSYSTGDSCAGLKSSGKACGLA
jgi:hypothetical protein